MFSHAPNAILLFYPHDGLQSIDIDIEKMQVYGGLLALSKFQQ